MVLIRETRPSETSEILPKKSAAAKIEAAAQGTAPPATKKKELVAILVRGLPDITKPIKDTLLMLNLDCKNKAVIIEDNPVNKGMLSKVKDFVTWGEIDDETLKELVRRRGEEYHGRETDAKKKYSYLAWSFQGKKYKKYFRLNPPRKGFGRKGIKVSFKSGGALGYRGEKINELLRRMI